MTNEESSTERWDVVVVGAGPAGLVAATRAAERGRRTLLLEKGRRPGAKILVSGGTRCNLTHATDARGIVAAFGPQGRFLHSALAALDPGQVVAMFEAAGVRTKVEPGGKVFPASDRAVDVQVALVHRLAHSGCQLALEEPLKEVDRLDSGFRLTTSRRTLVAEKLVLATGGKSYPGCGTTGDGYRWAADLGHTIVAPRPALTPVTTAVDWVPPLAGITIADAEVQVIELGASNARKKPLAASRGSLLFAHFGLTGPAALNVSRAVARHDRPRSLASVCDFLPSMRETELDASLSDQCVAAGRRQTAGILDHWLPRRLAETIMAQAGVSVERRAAELSRRDRQHLVHLVKRLEIPVTGTLGFEKAEVTSGGVALNEVDSRNLQSKLVPNLFFAGELLDLDGPIGGYNFQCAFSTGWLVGGNV